MFEPLPNQGSARAFAPAPSATQSPSAHKSDAKVVVPEQGGVSDVRVGFLDHLPDPLFAIGSEGGISALNSAASALIVQKAYGLDGDTSARGLLDRLRIVNRDDGLPWTTPPRKASTEALIAFATTYQGEQLFNVLATPQPSDSARSFGWIVQLTDVTELAAALKTQAEASRHRDGLLDLLSHDMRTPLVSIITTLSHPDLKSMPDNLRQIIDQSARRGLRMIDSSVRLVRAESSDYVLEPIEIGYVVEEAIDLSWQVSDLAGIRIVVPPATSDFIVMLDRGMIIQAFTILLTTVIAAGVGGGSLLFKLDSASLDGKPAVTGTLIDSRPASGEPIVPVDQAARKLSAKDSTVDADGLSFVRTVISRQGGSLTQIEEAGGRKIIIALPLAEQ